MSKRQGTTSPLAALDRQRRILNYSQAYIAKRMWCCDARVSNLLTGKQEPKLSDIWSLMDILHIPPEQMAEYFPRPKT